MGQKAPHLTLALLPPPREKVETIKILKQTNKSTAALAELKGMAKTIPNQDILVNAIVLQEAKDSSEIENIITTKDKLYKAVSSNGNKYDQATKEVMFYREALYEGFKKIKERGLLSINDIVDLQKILIQNEAGIRKTPGTALVNDKTDEIIFTPPQGKDEISNLL